MAKFVIRQASEPSQIKKVIDLHKYAKSRNKFFKISLLFNWLQLVTIAILIFELIKKANG